MAPTWRPRSLQSRPRVPKSHPRVAQEPPKNVQEPPKTAQECSRRPRSSPGAAQDSLRASQKPTKIPRRDPGPAQEPFRTSQIRSRPHALPMTSAYLPTTAQSLPRSSPETTPYPLEDNSQLHHAILQNFFPCHKAANFKNERRRYSPQGGLQSAALRGRRVGWGYEVFLSFWILLPDSSSQRFLSSPS